MAGQFDVHYLTASIPAVTGTVDYPLFKNISANGCITILSSHCIAGAAGSVTAELVTMETTAGTKNGTVGAYGSAGNVYAAGVPQALTVSSAVVPPDSWVALKLGAGTAGANGKITIGYLKGQ